MVLLTGVIVLDLIIIGRAAMRMRFERALRAHLLRVSDPRPGTQVVTGFRWLPPLDSDAPERRRSRPGEGGRHG